MSWIYLSLLSAMFLGVYDLVKKHALKENAVLPVLFFGVISAAVIWLAMIGLQASIGNSLHWGQFQVEAIGAHAHISLFFKAALVGSSWIFGYFALKNLPVSIVGPIRATSPMWTILFAVCLMGERLSAMQWTGVSIILGSFYAFSLVGKREGIRFHKDKWIGCILIATLLGAVSAIYDKYLLQSARLSPATVQAWFSIDMVIVILPFYLLWRRGAWPRGTFQWRWSIPLIGICLLMADFLYFTAIAQDGALISVISPIRRASVLISFLGGIALHGERNFKPKAICICLLLGGISFLYWQG
jgi:uncharacterized membrane protein